MLIKHTVNNLQLLDAYFSKFLHGIQEQKVKRKLSSHSDVHDCIVMRKTIVKENTNLSKNECFFSHNWSLHHHQPPPQKNRYCSWQIERLNRHRLVLLESILPFFWKFSPLLSFLLGLLPLMCSNHQWTAPFINNEASAVYCHCQTSCTNHGQNDATHVLSPLVP